MDYTATAILLAQLLFVQPNATAIINSADLATLAQIIDQTLPSGTTDGSPYIAGIQSSLSGDLASLSTAQIASAVGLIVALRNPPAGD